MQKGPNRLTWHLLDCPCYSAILSARLDTNPPESSGMKARHASESKKAKEGDDPANSKAEQGDIMVRMVAIRREKVDVQEVPGAAEAGEQRDC